MGAEVGMTGGFVARRDERYGVCLRVEVVRRCRLAHRAAQSGRRPVEVLGHGVRLPPSISRGMAGLCAEVGIARGNVARSVGHSL